MTKLTFPKLPFPSCFISRKSSLLRSTMGFWMISSEKIIDYEIPVVSDSSPSEYLFPFSSSKGVVSLTVSSGELLSTSAF